LIVALLHERIHRPPQVEQLERAFAAQQECNNSIMMRG